MKKENIILTKSFDFALSIIALYQELVKEKEYIISKQLLRSGTSIGANVEVSTAAISRKDFIASLSIASKESRETRYWLRLLDKSDLTQNDLTQYLNEIEDIINILTAIIKTSQSN